MKTNKILHRSSVVALSLVASLPLVLTGCQDEEFGYDLQDVRNSKYEKDFVATFGEIDPNHTWSTATRASFTIDINFDGVYTVKVYTANPRYPENDVYLVGQFDNVESGTHTFGCDLPSSVECAYVGLIDSEGNRMILPARVLSGKASVSFGSKTMTRTVYSGTYSGTVPFTYGQGNLKEWTEEDLMTPLRTLPEQVNNTGKVTQNFEYISMGEFTIYPIYSITTNHGDGWGDNFGEKLGIYLYDKTGQVIANPDGTPEVTQIWHMNRGKVTGDDSHFDGVNGTWYEAHDKDSKQWKQMSWFFDGNVAGANASNCVWDLSTNKMRPAYDMIRSYGIRLNIPAGTRFGFALMTDHGYIYSNSIYNKDEGGVGTNNVTPDHIRDTYGATFHDAGKLYLAFEDWGYSMQGHDTDFNDLVLTLIPSTGSLNPLIIDKDVATDPIIYIVACEDLGGTFDWDFNDVVFGIEHVSGQPTARVKLLAAGGTLPISIKYKGPKKQDDGTIKKDVWRDVHFNDELGGSGSTRSLHAAFGVADNIPVNVGAVNGVNHDPVYSEPMTVSNPYEFSVLEGAALFTVHVEYGDHNTNDAEGIHVPNINEKKKVPQAFLIADPNWEWPTERQFIADKYSSFISWVSDAKYSKWTNKIWGNQREFNAIPSGAANMLAFEGAVTYSDSVATITISKDNDKMSYGVTYNLALMISDQANAEFQLSNGTKIETAPDGTVQANKLTTFTINSDVVKAIKDSGADGKLVITFPEGTVAQGKVLLASWYRAGQKLVSHLVAQSPMEIKCNTSASLVYTTENQESPVTFSSSNPEIVYVSDDGVITGRAVTSTSITITLHQASSEHYEEATATVAVNVISELDLCEVRANVMVDEKISQGPGKVVVSTASNFYDKDKNVLVEKSVALANGEGIFVTRGTEVTFTAPTHQDYTFVSAGGNFNKETMSRTDVVKTDESNPIFGPYFKYTEKADPGASVSATSITLDAINTYTLYFQSSNGANWPVLSDPDGLVEITNGPDKNGSIDGDRIKYVLKAKKRGTGKITISQAATSTLKSASFDITVNVDYGEKVTFVSGGNYKGAAASGETWHFSWLENVMDLIDNRDLSKGVTFTFVLPGYGLTNFAIGSNKGDTGMKKTLFNNNEATNDAVWDSKARTLTYIMGSQELNSYFANTSSFFAGGVIDAEHLSVELYVKANN